MMCFYVYIFIILFSLKFSIQSKNFSINIYQLNSYLSFFIQLIANNFKKNFKEKRFINKMFINKDENVHRLALSAIREELLEIEREREKEKKER